MFQDDTLYKFTYLLTYLLTYKVVHIENGGGNYCKI